MSVLRSGKQDYSPFLKWGIYLFILFLMTAAVRFVLGKYIFGLDYLFYWDAGRALLIDKLDPYSSEVAARIYYAIFNAFPPAGKLPVPFLYPLYLIIVTLPLSFVSFDWAQSFWMVLFILLPIGIGSLYLTQVPRWLAITFLFFYQMWFTTILGNIALPIGFLLISIIYALIFTRPAHSNNGTDIFLGAALAWLTGKPQMVYLFVLLILVISFRNRRFNILKGFAGGFVLLNLLAFIMKPDWLLTWINTVLYYPQYESTRPLITTFLAFLFPKANAIVMTCFAVFFLLLASIWFIRAWRQTTLSDIGIFAWAAFLQYLFDPASRTPDQIIFLVPFFLWVFSRNKTLQAKIFWFGGILLSNLLFIMGTKNAWSNVTDAIPPLIYAAWLVYFMVNEIREGKRRKELSLVSV